MMESNEAALEAARSAAEVALESARATADQIREEARERTKQIFDQAEAEAEQMVDQAEEAAEIAREEAEFACREAVLVIRKRPAFSPPRSRVLSYVPPQSTGCVRLQAFSKASIRRAWLGN